MPKEPTLVELLDLLVGKPTFAHDIYSAEQIEAYRHIKRVLQLLDEKEAATNAPYSDTEYKVWE